jgi:dienelactone hydrolase/Tol biopolymer transport system component
MTQTSDLAALKSRAETYFDRPSFAAPVFIGDDRIAVLDDRSGTPQVSVVTVSTGAVSNVTSYKERILTLKGSSRSGRILFGMDDGGNERQQLWTIPASGGDPVRLTHASDSIHEPGCLSTPGDYVLFRSNARDEATFDVRGMSLDGGEQVMWLQAGGQVMPVDVSEDSERVLVIRLNGNLDGDLLLVSRNGEQTNLTPHEGEQWVLGATFTPDGTGVRVLSNLDREFVALVHIDLQSGERTIVYQDEWDVEHFKVSPDGRFIALSVNVAGGSRPMLIRADGSYVPLDLDVPRGVIDQFSWAPDASCVVFGFSTTEDPSVIMVAELDGSTRIVANAGQERARPRTVTPELIHYTTWDGREIPAFFFRPEDEGPFPVLIDVHGGPESQRRLNFTPSGPILQYFASLGMGVLSLNVRGSTGYGKAYSHLDDKDLRLDSVKDVAEAVTWLRGRDDVAGDRIAVMGQSYGGFMTLASIAFHPGLWAAAVDVVGIANFVSFLERTGPWRRKHRAAEYGDLENDRELLERISPLNHVDRITAPLLVIHGRNDPRVPLFEAEQVVAALEERGRDVALRVYDDEGHGLSKRPNKIDGYATAAEFLTRHLGLV